MGESIEAPLVPVLLVAVAGAIAGYLARERPAFRGGLTGVAMIVALALTEPFRPAAESIPADLAATLILDVVILATGVAAGWAGGRLRRR